jgi:CheY-like chemotaxis protein
MTFAAPAAATILTVEDDPIVQRDLRLILEDAGYVVCPSARDGIEAVEQARRHRPDLILMDLGLPRLDGVAATERILRERDVPIVALTGRSNQDSLDRATAAGAVRQLVKPFSEQELVHTLADVLAARRRAAGDRHLKVMIESMVRAGVSERQIVAAVEREAGRPPAHSPGLIERIVRSVGQLGQVLRRS